jgi:hypothetical protein
MQGISTPFDEVLDSLQGFCSMEFSCKACKIPGRSVFLTPHMDDQLHGLSLDQQKLG